MPFSFLFLLDQVIIDVSAPAFSLDELIRRSILEIFICDPHPIMGNLVNVPVDRYHIAGLVGYGSLFEQSFRDDLIGICCPQYYQDKQDQAPCLHPKVSGIQLSISCEAAQEFFHVVVLYTIESSSHLATIFWTDSLFPENASVNHV